MSSYIDFYQDFLQKKETFVGRRVSTVSLPEEQEEQDNGQTIHADIINESSKNMEHSYTRDTTIRPPLNEPSTGLAPARTVLVRRPPQCPSCHTHPIEEHELNDGNQAVIPSYNEIAAKEAMNECARIAKYVKNVNSDEENWETRISRNGWSSMQKSLYDKVVNILDNDHLGRLSNFGRQNEVMQRRVLTDKSASRMRKALASVAWDSRLTQWLHCLLMDYLPSTYMASYLDILQTLKTKVPSLIDKMLFMRPLNVSQELLAPVMKKQWEPLINTKARILTHNVIIVALPSLPYGSIPRRIQKWYQHLAGITQILQITLPTTGGHTAQQPINQVAEQIVSLTRVKLQELKHENSSRSIILIGFGAGSALALQVAMSESIAAVICMGFAYNTLKGVRGKPDDRILDIKIPILFVIGQNSQRTSSEEIESLREKMQSESSLVIVGSADDMLRVPKSRRKIENVTQSMIDAMVVDEVFEFMKKILTNPPGPRIPTAIVNTSFNKHSKTNLTNDGKIVSTSRKRKQDGTIETESTAAKSKFCPQIGRPRTRPIPSTAPVAKTAKVYTPPSLQSTTNDSTSTTLTNEDLNIAIQSILQEPATEGTTDSTSPSIIDNTQKKIVTNFELVAQPKSANTPNSFLNINNTMGTKIRMIPPNQFLQLKPPLQSQSKIYTIKTTPTQTTQQSGGTCNIGSIVNTSAASTINSAQQQHIFTLKSPNGQTTQFVTAAPPAAQQKYTVLKNAAGGTTLQLTRTSVLKNQSMETSNVDIPNIIDMPIVFADHEGNIADSVDNTDGNKDSSSNPTLKPNIGQLIINQKLAKDSSTSAPLSPNLPKGGGTFVIGRPTASLQQSTIIQTGQLTSKPNKVLFINRNTMKPCSNIIGQTSGSTQKFAKVLVTNPKLSNGGSIVSRPSIILTTSANTPTLSGSSIVSSVKKFNFQTLKSNVSGSKPTSGILNVSTKSIPQVQIINAAPGSSTTIGSNVIGQSSNVTQLSDRPQVRNIVVKAGGLKQVSPQLTSQLLNRNLTVRKLVNIVPVTKPTTVTAGGNVTISSPLASQTTPEEGSNISAISNSNLTLISSIQSSPKIFTLNPVSTTAEPESTQNVQ